MLNSGTNGYGLVPKSCSLSRSHSAEYNTAEFEIQTWRVPFFHSYANFVVEPIEQIVVDQNNKKPIFTSIWSLLEESFLQTNYKGMIWTVESIEHSFIRVWKFVITDQDSKWPQLAWVAHLCIETEFPWRFCISYWQRSYTKFAAGHHELTSKCGAGTASPHICCKWHAASDWRIILWGHLDQQSYWQSSLKIEGKHPSFAPI